MQSPWQERVALHRSRVDPSLAEGSRGRKPLSPDGERILTQGRDRGKKTRLYEQSLRSGEPRPITADGVETTLSFPFSPSVKEVLVFSDKAWRIQPVGAESPPLPPGFKTVTMQSGWGRTAVPLPRGGPAMISVPADVVHSVRDLLARRRSRVDRAFAESERVKHLVDHVTLRQEGTAPVRGEKRGAADVDDLAARPGHGVDAALPAAGMHLAVVEVEAADVLCGGEAPAFEVGLERPAFSILELLEDLAAVRVVQTSSRSLDRAARGQPGEATEAHGHRVLGKGRPCDRETREPNHGEADTPDPSPTTFHDQPLSGAAWPSGPSQA